MNPSGRPTPTSPGLNPPGDDSQITRPGQLAGQPAPRAVVAAGSPLDDISARDVVLLELLVHMSFRLRLHGVDLEITTGWSDANSTWSHC